MSVGCSQTTYAANEGCVFKNLLRGIHVGSNTKVIYIHKNTFSNSFTDTYSNFPSGSRTGQYGMYLQPLGDASIAVVKIDSNSISNCALGVHIVRTSAYTGTGIQINENSITASGTTNAYCNKGIFMEDLSSCTTCMASASIEIKKNTITNIEEKVIHCSGVQSGLDIACNNELSLRYRATGGNMANGPTFDVIRLDNCKNSFTRFNNLIRTSGGNTQVANVALTGIYVNNSTAAGNNNTIDANDIRYLGSCMVFEGNNPSGTVFARNTMNNTKYGMYMNTNAAFNSQPSGNLNKWGTTAFLNQTFNNNAADVNTMAKITVYTGSAGTGLTYVPTSHAANTTNLSVAYTTGSAGTDGIITTTVIPIACTNCSSPCGGGEEGLIGGGGDQQGMMVDGEEEENGMQEMNAVVENAATDSSETALYDAERKWLNKKWAFENIFNNQPAYSGNTELQTFYTALQNEPIGLFTQAEAYIAANAYTDALQVLNSITPDNVIEHYLLDVYKMQVNGKLDTAYSYSETEMNTLYAIASACELSGGPAVLKARALYNELIEGYMPFEYNCSENAGARLSQTKKVQIDLNFNVFPNPSAGKFTIEYALINEKEKATVHIYSLEGKKLNAIKLSVGTTETSFDLNSLANGVYMYKVERNGVILKTDRLIIMK